MNRFRIGIGHVWSYYIKSNCKIYVMLDAIWSIFLFAFLIMDIYTELIRSHIATCNAMKTDLKHALAVQDWKPSAHCSDSQENQDTDTQDEAIGNHDMDSVGEVEPEPLGQPLFQDELNELFAELEHNLPPVPLQGPDQPQVPSPPRDPATGGEVHNHLLCARTMGRWLSFPWLLHAGFQL